MVLWLVGPDKVASAWSSFWLLWRQFLGFHITFHSFQVCIEIILRVDGFAFLRSVRETMFLRFKMCSVCWCTPDFKSISSNGFVTIKWKLDGIYSGFFFWETVWALTLTQPAHWVVEVIPRRFQRSWRCEHAICVWRFLVMNFEPSTVFIIAFISPVLLSHYQVLVLRGISLYTAVGILNKCTQ